MTQAKLKALFRYDPCTGMFTRLIRRGPAPAGSTPGVLHPTGYLRIEIDGLKYPAHRLAWLYVYGRFPNPDTDHINGVRHDNRIANLRETDRSGNRQNLRSAHRNSVSGYLGVCFCARKKSKRWAAAISVNHKKRHIGEFETPGEAHAAYLTVKRELHPAGTL